jgi:hypothetical protein
MWKDMKYTGDGTWLYHAIRNGTLLCVSDGSYIPQFHPDICSAAIICECQQGLERLSLSLVERSSSANAFRGELLGLLMIHLLLLSIHKSESTLTGSMKIYSDCTGALSTVALLKNRVPASWKHSDILKILAINCSPFPYHRSLCHG